MEFSLQAKFLSSSHTLAMWLITDARNKFISPSLGRNEFSGKSSQEHMLSRGPGFSPISLIFVFLTHRI